MRNTNSHTRSLDRKIATPIRSWENSVEKIDRHFVFLMADAIFRFHKITLFGRCIQFFRCSSEEAVAAMPWHRNDLYNMRYPRSANDTQKLCQPKIISHHRVRCILPWNRLIDSTFFATHCKQLAISHTIYATDSIREHILHLTYFHSINLQNNFNLISNVEYAPVVVLVPSKKLNSF